MTEEQQQAEVQRQTKSDKRRNNLILQALIALVGLVVVCSVVLLYVNYSQRQDDLRWCKLMVGLDDRYQSLPPTADSAAREFANNIHELRGELHCPRPVAVKGT